MHGSSLQIFVGLRGGADIFGKFTLIYHKVRVKVVQLLDGAKSRYTQASYSPYAAQNRNCEFHAGICAVYSDAISEGYACGGEHIVKVFFFFAAYLVYVICCNAVLTGCDGYLTDLYGCDAVIVVKSVGTLTYKAAVKRGVLMMTGKGIYFRKIFRHRDGYVIVIILRKRAYHLTHAVCGM